MDPKPWFNVSDVCNSEVTHRVEIIIVNCQHQWAHVRILQLCGHQQCGGRHGFQTDPRDSRVDVVHDHVGAVVPHSPLLLDNIFNICWCHLLRDFKVKIICFTWINPKFIVKHLSAKLISILQFIFINYIYVSCIIRVNVTFNSYNDANGAFYLDLPDFCNF